MKITNVLLATFISFSIAANAQEPIFTIAELQKATVYRKGTTLEHKAKVYIPKGNSELVIKNVANFLDEKSIQLSVPSSVTILSIRFDNTTLDYLNDTINTNKIEKQKLLEMSLLELNNKEDAERSTLAMVQDYVKGLNANAKEIKIEEIARLTDFYKKQQIEIRNNIAALSRQKIELQKELQDLQQKTGIGNADINGTGKIIVQLMAPNAINSEINLSYLSQNASWSPAYDFRVSDVNKPLNIVHKANITQSTGVDWQQVKLSLSTGNPIQGNVAPNLKPWLLSYFLPVSSYQNNAAIGIQQALDGAAPGLLVTSGNGQPGSNGDIMLRGQGSLSASAAPLVVLDGAPYSGALNTINPADIKELIVLKDATSKAVYGARAANGVILITTKENKNRAKSAIEYANVEEQIAFTNFDITVPYDIPSNNKSQTVVIEDQKKEVRYKYLAIPKLDSDAFLMAELTNFESMNLMPGTANLIYNNYYVGQSYINPLIADDTLNLSLGRDKKIIVNRKQIQDKASSNLLGSNRKQTFSYEITVKNTKSVAIDLKVQDQFPLASDGNMEVNLIESSNANNIDKETGIISWNLNLQPNETKVLKLSYSVKHPNGKRIVNL